MFSTAAKMLMAVSVQGRYVVIMASSKSLLITLDGEAAL